VVLNSQWIFANQVLGILIDRRWHASWLAFESALRPAFNSGVGGYTDKSCAMSRCELIYSRNFHDFGFGVDRDTHRANTAVMVELIDVVTQQGR
jgi:hypothetical protein